MKIKKFIPLSISVIAFILELIPYGVVLNFSNQNGEVWQRSYSYFSLTPLGYANVGPFIAAILTCVLYSMALIYIKENRRGLSIAIAAVSGVAAVASLAPIFYGIRYFTILGGIITALLTACFAGGLVDSFKMKEKN